MDGQIVRTGSCVAGECKLPPAEACADGFACISAGADLKIAVCGNSCSDDAACRKGFHCVEGRCRVTLSECEDSAWEKPADGPRRSCAPYSCIGRACATSCLSLTDCAVGFECRASGACVERAPAVADEQGCAASRGHARLDPLVGLLALGLLRRRRSRRLHVVAKRV